MMYHKLRVQAEQKFGVSETRPQDDDKNMMVTARRNNLGLKAEPPQDYTAKIYSIPASFQISKSHLSKIDMGSQQTIWMLKDDYTEGPWSGVKVVAVDFEFHNIDTFDAFICVASLAIPGKTFVLDCLYDHRRWAQLQLTSVLLHEETLKVFCGGDQDLIQLKKDWDCFVLCFVDLQDMFVVWRKEKFDDCFGTCYKAIRAKLQEKKASTTDEKIREYLRGYSKPGLDFLIKVFISSKDIVKDPIATHADFRVRPLHQDLIKYAANDATATLLIFNELALKIGKIGIKTAMQMGVAKLMNYSKPPTHKPRTPLPPGFVSAQVKTWREYIAKRLDKNPELLITSANLKTLIQRIQEHGFMEEDVLLLLTKIYTDDAAKALKLLKVHMDLSGEELRRMEATICHRCNTTGHPVMPNVFSNAQFCFKIMSEEEERECKREFRMRAEMKEKNHAQHNRRWYNYCQKRGLDPDATPKPWEKDANQS